MTWLDAQLAAWDQTVKSIEKEKAMRSTECAVLKP